MNARLIWGDPELTHTSLICCWCQMHGQVNNFDTATIVSVDLSILCLLAIPSLCIPCHLHRSIASRIVVTRRRELSNSLNTYWQCMLHVCAVKRAKHVVCITWNILECTTYERHRWWQSYIIIIINKLFAHTWIVPFMYVGLTQARPNYDTHKSCMNIMTNNYCAYSNLCSPRERVYHGCLRKQL